MNNLPVQPATGNDFPAIRALLQSYQLPYEDLDREDRYSFLVVREEGDIIGTIGMENYHPDGLLRSLAVREDFRGKGYGKALVKRLESLAKAQKIETLYLLTTTAAAFFQAMGYHMIERENAPHTIQQTSEFSTVCPGTATCMRKDFRIT